MPLIFLAIIMAPIIELTVLVKVAMEIGVFPAIGLSILTAIVGISLVRSQGVTVLMKLRADMNRGVVDNAAVLEGALLAIAGFMLLFPGFISDTIGALMLVPLIRRGSAEWLIKRRGVAVSMQRSHDGQRHTADKHDQGNVFEGEYERKDDASKHHLDDK